MSNTDSFIDEVTEEVQKDKLFGQLKRWGWVGGLAVLLLVGGAAYNEWRKANERQVAQEFGDQLIASLDGDDTTAALAGLKVDDAAQSAVLGHLSAAAALADGDTDAGIAALEGVQNNASVAAVYRELAAFKAALALPPETDSAEKILAFEAITGPFRPLAQEQKAMVMIQSGDTEGATDLLRTLLEAADATPGLQRRASEMIVALGADISDTDADDG
ncbi:hypothetical protein [uncultured Litoreibacter sp.]|uniref:hypothetical protein n=1 Tax=uncultured Litoreibacter sp. TaxID=1392394 RepID=UPI0026301CD4|nr:hypothetical protein [uncultured Litoreibacter sp.]